MLLGVFNCVPNFPFKWRAGATGGVLSFQVGAADRLLQAAPGKHASILIRIKTLQAGVSGKTAGKRAAKQCSTRGSQEIPQPSTNRAQPRLTSEF